MQRIVTHAWLAGLVLGGAALALGDGGTIALVAVAVVVQLLAGLTSEKRGLGAACAVVAVSAQFLCPAIVLAAVAGRLDTAAQLSGAALATAAVTGAITVAAAHLRRGGPAPHAA